MPFFSLCALRVPLFCTELLAAGEKRRALLDTATALVARDGEVVLLEAPLLLTGPVECWLNDVANVMKSTLRRQLMAALEAACQWELDVPRDMASQIMWTDDTEHALEELEAGNEEALRNYLITCTTRLTALVAQVRVGWPVLEASDVNGGGRLGMWTVVPVFLACLN